MKMEEMGCSETSELEFRRREITKMKECNIQNTGELEIKNVDLSLRKNSVKVTEDDRAEKHQTGSSNRLIS
jgi:hypothetical protein